MRGLVSTPVLLACALAAAAHDIPSDVTVQMVLKPSSSKLQLLVRVPLSAIRDVDFPELQSGYLDVEKLAPQLPAAASLWIADFVTLYEGDRRLPKPSFIATQLSLPSDRTFASFDEALRHITGPKLANSANVSWQHLMFDVLFEYPIDSQHSKFSIQPGLERLGARVITVLRFVSLSGAVRAYEFLGDAGLVHLDPGWRQAAARFVELGFSHILEGTDHLLFLLCLVLPFRQFRPLLKIVTAFTLAHSLTLIASAYGLGPDTLWFPPLIETLIASSILYMALENIAGANTAQRRWMFAFGFGLVHGFGFSFALRQNLQFAGAHLLASLLAFNVGVELGQVLVLLVLIPALDIVFRFVIAERMGTIIVSALIAHTGWHWIAERADRLRQFRFEWPAITAGALAWVVPIALLVAVARLFLRRRERSEATSRAPLSVEPKSIRNASRIKHNTRVI